MAKSNDHAEKLDILRDFIGCVKGFEEQFEDILPEFPTEAQIYRLDRTPDAGGRLPI